MQIDLCINSASDVIIIKLYKFIVYASTETIIYIVTVIQFVIATQIHAINTSSLNDMKLVNKGINVCMRKYSNVHKFYHRIQLAPGHGQHGINQKLNIFLMTFCMIMHQQIATKLQGSRFCLYYVLSITVSHSRLLLWLQGHHTTCIGT